jgi:hypothetical protein
MRRLIGISIVVLLAGALLPSPSAIATNACETVAMRTFRVRVVMQDDVYRMREKAHAVLTVTRKATAQPVADAQAAIAIYNKRKSNRVGFAWGQTDDRGRIHLRVKVLRSYIRSGPVTLFAYAYISQVDTYCASVSEYGYRKIPRAFRATP